MRLVALLERGGRAREAREAQLAHALRSVPVFAELPREDLLAVWRSLHELRLPAGAVVFQRGDPGDRFPTAAEMAAACRAALP